MMKKTLIFLFFVSVLSSCITSNIVLDVQRAADITIAQDIQNVVVVNRSRPSKKNLPGNIVEGIISGEAIGVDRKGSEYCVEGLSNMLLSSERFELKNVGGMELKGTGTSTFPVPLDWNEVISICGSYDADAILSLETFDSDTRTIYGEPYTRVIKKNKLKIKEIRYPATLIMEIESGWRIYDANNKKIIDENRFREVKEFNSNGLSVEEATRKLPSKRSAIKESGLFAGQQYGFRISPVWIKVGRSYFIAGDKQLKLAKSHVRNGDWDAAINIWKDLVNNLDKKIAGRSAYNMALASEVKGGIDTALEWANRAKKIGEKKADKYINVLHIRKLNEEKLKKQLNN